MPPPTIKVPVKFVPDPTLGNSLLDVSSLDPAGATDGQIIRRVAGQWAPSDPPTVDPTVVENSAATFTVPAGKSTLVIHKSTVDSVYALDPSPVDMQEVIIQRDLLGTGLISIDGNGHDIDIGTAVAPVWGPSTISIFSARFFAAAGKWRA